MYKDVTQCKSCSHYLINPDGVPSCSNQRGLPFPSPEDYCSNGEATDASREVSNSEILKLVYAQRRQA